MTRSRSSSSSSRSRSSSVNSPERVEKTKDGEEVKEKTTEGAESNKEKQVEKSPERRGRSPIRAPARSPSRSRSPVAKRDRRRDRSASRDRGRDRSASRERRRRRSRSNDSDRGDRRTRDRREDSVERRRRRTRSRSIDRRRRHRSDSDDERERKRRRSPARSRSPQERSRRRDESSPPPRREKRARRDQDEQTPEKESAAKGAEAEKQKKEPLDLLRTRAGGAYIPPAKLKMMQEQMTDKSSEQYQRLNWERLKKRIHGDVNKVNVENLVRIVRSLLQENIVRGKGLLTRSIIQAQAFSPGFSHVYAGLVAVINSKFPFIGELLVRRLVVQFKRCFRRGDKATTITVTKFLAHLINQQVTHELLGLEISLLMLEKPTDDSVEVAIAFIKECGAKLGQVAPRALASVVDRFRAILSGAEGVDKRTQYMIEALFSILKDKFQAYPAVIEDLDLIDEEDQITHMVTLEDAIDPENILNIFKLDPEFEKNEAEYEEVRREVIGDAEDSDDEQEEEEEDKDDEEDEENEPEEGSAAAQLPGGKKKGEPMEIIDNTELSLVAFRREVYLTIQSSLDFQEAAHKLLKMGVKPELEPELCHMLVDCCCQQRTYERFYGYLIERFCRLKKEFQMTFEQIIRDGYRTIHRFDITKLRNMARLTAHLLQTDAIDWMILDEVKLNERDTTSSGRIWLREVFQELSREMSMVKLYERTNDPTLQRAFAGIFPRDNPEDTRFSINFFTIIGLGGLSIDLREWLDKHAKKRQKVEGSDGEKVEDTSSSSSSSDSDSDSDSSDSDSSSSSSESSESESSEDDKKKKKRKKQEQKKSKDKKKRKEHKKREETEKKVKEEAEEEETSRKERKRKEETQRRERTPEKADKKRKEETQRRERTPEKAEKKRKEETQNRERTPEKTERRRDDRDKRDDRRKKDDYDERKNKRSQRESATREETAESERRGGEETRKKRTSRVEGSDNRKEVRAGSRERDDREPRRRHRSRS